MREKEERNRESSPYLQQKSIVKLYYCNNINSKEKKRCVVLFSFGFVRNRSYNRASVYKEQNIKMRGSVEVVAYCVFMALLE